MRSREPREKDGSAQNSNLRFDFRRKTVISGSASGLRQSLFRPEIGSAFPLKAIRTSLKKDINPTPAGGQNLKYLYII